MVKVRNAAMWAAMVLLVIVASSGVIFLAEVASTGGTISPVRVSQHAAVAIEWTGLGEHVEVPSGLTIAGHAGKHIGQHLNAWIILDMLLSKQCVASAVFCGPSDIEKLYLCVDPTGRIGGLIVFGEEILTGYQANQDYWTRKVGKPEWEVCRD